MRATAPCVIRRDRQVVIRGDADLQSGPRGWRVAVYATSKSAIHDLSEGRYELVMPSGKHPIRFASVRLATREIRFVGIGDPPGELAPLSPRPVDRPRRRG